MVAIRAIHDLARCLGAARQEIDIECPTTVAALMTFLADRHGDELRNKFVRKEGSVWNTVVLVNGRNIFAGEGLQTVVQEGDEVLFMSPIGGG